MIYLSIIELNIERDYKGDLKCQTGASQILLYSVPPRTLLAFVRPFSAATMTKKYRLILIDWTLCPPSYDAKSVLEYQWVKNLGIATVEQLREHFDADPKHRATADAWAANIEKYGAPNWYEWRCQHWGTKWNACDAEVTDNGDGSLHVQFNTAWSFPFPIFEKLVGGFSNPNF
jgi:hypothetical protein